MDKNYQELHSHKLEKLKEKVFGTDMYDRLQMRALSNKALNEVIQKINAVISPRQVWDDFSFRTGKIIGILRSIAQNPMKRNELLEVTGLTQTHVDLYFEVCGNLPFLRNDNTIDPGRTLNPEGCKELIQLVGAHFGYVVEDADLLDINEERWTHLVKAALERAQQTAQHNEEHSGEETQYDE